MRYEMTGKERKSLRKIAKRVIIQSPSHTENIVEYYKIIVEAARKEFFEDNEVTLYKFLLELFQKAFIDMSNFKKELEALINRCNEEKNNDEVNTN